MSVGFRALLAREPPGSWEVIVRADMRKGSIFDTLCKWFLQHYTYFLPVASRPESQIG
ncbi:MAG: hypothetical protein JWL65_6326 [Gammaproteobacteria bacterium]|nr:hypothetical protein [Gammaproteobacteria bacterium]